MDVPPCEELIGNREGQEGLLRNPEDKTQCKEFPLPSFEVTAMNRTAESELGRTQNNPDEQRY